MTKPKLLFKSVLALLLIVCTVGLYSPHLVYYAQPDYFTEYFTGLVWKPLVFMMLLAALLWLILLFLPQKLLKFISAILLVVSLLLWLQTDFFAVSYGVLDGSQINFEPHNSRGVIELAVIGACLVLTLIFNRLVNQHLPFVVGLLIIGQIAMTSAKVIQEPETKTTAVAMDPEFLNYSSKKNVLIIVLDTFGSDFFQEILANNPEFRDKFDGFVSYTDAISNYPATSGSLPSMLTGQMFPADVKFRSFINDVVGVNGIPKKMEEAGYIVSVVSVYSWFKKFYEKRYMYEPNLNPEDLRTFYGAQLLDYSLFRVSPHYLKPKIYNEGTWLTSELVATETTVPNTFPERGNLILDAMTQGAIIGGDEPRFKMLHVTTPHPEFVFNEACEKDQLPDGKTNSYYMYQQSVCALKKLESLLVKYKSMGIYDNSLIIVTSDHGSRLLGNKTLTGFPSYFEMNTSGILFMIKGIGQKDQFKQVDQPFSLIKLYDAVMDFSLHESKYDDLLDENRLFYSFRNNHKGRVGYLNDAPLFTVSADHKNPESWQLIDFIQSKCEPSDWPVKMTFKTNGREQNCAKYGFASPDTGTGSTWTQSVDSRIIFKLKADETDTDARYKLTLKFKPFLHASQPMIKLNVRINDQAVGQAEIARSGDQELTFEVDGSVFNTLNQKQVISLLMPGLKPASEMMKNGDSRKLGLQISALNIEQSTE